jgi:hypothetical protein
MDEILERLRGRVQVPTTPAQGGTPRGAAVAARDGSYAEVLESVILVLRDVENLRSMLTPQRLRALTGDQEQELLTLLGRVLQEMRSCEAALDQVPRRDQPM